MRDRLLKDKNFANRLSIWVNESSEGEDREGAADKIVNAYYNDLESIYLKSFGLKSLPEEIGELSSLVSINCYRNQLSEIPESIYMLNGLRSLNLDSNNFTQIPSLIGRFNALESLDLSRNYIDKVSDSLIFSGSLKELVLVNNKLEKESISKLEAKFAGKTDFHLKISLQNLTKDTRDRSLGSHIVTKISDRIGSRKEAPVETEIVSVNKNQLDSLFADVEFLKKKQINSDEIISSLRNELGSRTDNQEKRSYGIFDLIGQRREAQKMSSSRDLDIKLTKAQFDAIRSIEGLDLKSLLEKKEFKNAISQINDLVGSVEEREDRLELEVKEIKLKQEENLILQRRKFDGQDIRGNKDYDKYLQQALIINDPKLNKVYCQIQATLNQHFLVEQLIKSNKFDSKDGKVASVMSIIASGVEQTSIPFASSIPSAVGFISGNIGGARRENRYDNYSQLIPEGKMSSSEDIFEIITRGIVILKKVEIKSLEEGKQKATIFSFADKKKMSLTLDDYAKQIASNVKENILNGNLLKDPKSGNIDENATLQQKITNIVKHSVDSIGVKIEAELIDEITASIEEAGNKSSKVIDYQEREKAKQDLEDLQSKVELLAQQQDYHDNSIKEKEERLQENTKEIVALKSQLKEFTHDSISVVKNEQEITRLQSVISGLEGANSSLVSEVTTIREYLSRSEEEMRKLQEEVRDQSVAYDESRDVADDLLSGFSIDENEKEVRKVLKAVVAIIEPIKYKEEAYKEELSDLRKSIEKNLEKNLEERAYLNKDLLSEEQKVESISNLAIETPSIMLDEKYNERFEKVLSEAFEEKIVIQSKLKNLKRGENRLLQSERVVQDEYQDFLSIYEPALEGFKDFNEKFDKSKTKFEDALEFYGKIVSLEDKAKHYQETKLSEKAISQLAEENTSLRKEIETSKQSSVLDAAYFQCELNELRGKNKILGLRLTKAEERDQESELFKAKMASEISDCYQKIRKSEIMIDYLEYNWSSVQKVLGGESGDVDMPRDLMVYSSSEEVMNNILIRSQDENGKRNQHPIFAFLESPKELFDFIKTSEFDIEKFKTTSDYQNDILFQETVNYIDQFRDSPKELYGYKGKEGRTQTSIFIDGKFSPISSTNRYLSICPSDITFTKEKDETIDDDRYYGMQFSRVYFLEDSDPENKLFKYPNFKNVSLKACTFENIDDFSRIANEKFLNTIKINNSEFKNVDFSKLHVDDFQKIMSISNRDSNKTGNTFENCIPPLGLDNFKDMFPELKEPSQFSTAGIKDDPATKVNRPDVTQVLRQSNEKADHSTVSAASL